jgi:hypothetical protein
MEENWHHTNILLNNENRIMGIAKLPMTIRSLCGIKYSPLFSFYLSKHENYGWIEKNKCWKFSKDTNNYQWVNNLPIKSIEALEEYVLMNQKISLLDKIHGVIEHQRSEQCKLLVGQESIYMAKYFEAKSILNSGLTKDELLNFPLVSGYATTKDISLQQAANEIELQYQIKSGFLSESENIRIKYTNLVRKENDISNIKGIFQEFHNESYRYAGL